MSDIGKKLGARVKALREGAGLTQAEVSRRSGMVRPNIARMEAGEHVPDVVSLLRVAAALRKQPSEIFCVLEHRAEDRSRRFQTYVVLERVTMELDDANDPLADKLRDVIDVLWLSLSDEEHDVLNAR